MNLGGSLTLVDGAGFTQTEIDLSFLDALSREVFVITDFEMDYGTTMLYDAAPNGVVAINGQITVSSQDSNININDPDVVGRFAGQLLTDALGGGGAYISHKQPEGPSSTGTSKDYLNIIATPNWFIGGNFVTTTGGATDKVISCRITGYRAVCDIGTYSAMIAEQLN